MRKTTLLVLSIGLTLCWATQGRAQGVSRIEVNGIVIEGARTVTIENGRIIVDGVEIKGGTMPGHKAVAKDEVFGKVVGVDTGENAISMQYWEANGRGLSEKLFKLAPGARVLLDGREGELADIGPGCDVQVKFSERPMRALEVKAEGPTVQAVLKAVDAERRTLTFTDHINAAKTWALADDAQVLQNTTVVKLADLKPNSRVTLRLSADGKTIRKVQLVGRVVGATRSPSLPRVGERGVDPTLPADFDRGFFPGRDR
jgi:hypothetical protein